MNNKQILPINKVIKDFTKAVTTANEFGTVIFIEEENVIMGKSVTIANNYGFIIKYYSLSTIYVNVGDYVSLGTIIGDAGECFLEEKMGVHLGVYFYDISDRIYDISKSIGM